MRYEECLESPTLIWAHPYIRNHTCMRTQLPLPKSPETTHSSFTHLTQQTPFTKQPRDTKYTRTQHEYYDNAWMK